MTNKREFRGVQLVLGKDNVQQVDPANFQVRSQSDPSKWHNVRWQRNRWVCDCPDFTKGPKCKHVYAVGYCLMLRDISLGVKNLPDDGNCPQCGSAEHVIKRGVRYNRSGPLQRYCCKRCGIKFAGKTAFRGMKNKATAIIAALDLYYRGLSLRQISEHLEASHRVNVTHGTVYHWIKKYVELVNQHVKSLRMETSERWHADETIVRVSGKHLMLWALLDAETRLLIATHISQGRGEEDAYVLLKKGLEKSENGPSEFVTDGLPSYGAALGKISKSMGRNHQLIHLHGSLTEALNNKMERFCGTVKARTKPMGGFGTKESTERFAEGFEAYYNFIKPHRSLGGKTPAQAAGLSKRKCTWLDLISNSGNA